MTLAGSEPTQDTDSTPASGAGLGGGGGGGTFRTAASGIEAVICATGSTAFMDHGIVGFKLSWGTVMFDKPLSCDGSTCGDGVAGANAGGGGGGGGGLGWRPTADCSSSAGICGGGGGGGGGGGVGVGNGTSSDTVRAGIPGELCSQTDPTCVSDTCVVDVGSVTSTVAAAAVSGAREARPGSSAFRVFFRGAVSAGAAKSTMPPMVPEEGEFGCASTTLSTTLGTVSACGGACDSAELFKKLNKDPTGSVMPVATTGAGSGACDWGFRKSNAEPKDDSPLGSGADPKPKIPLGSWTHPVVNAKADVSLASALTAALPKLSPENIPPPGSALGSKPESPLPFVELLVSLGNTSPKGSWSISGAG